MLLPVVITVLPPKQIGHFQSIFEGLIAHTQKAMDRTMLDKLLNTKSKIKYNIIDPDMACQMLD